MISSPGLSWAGDLRLDRTCHLGTTGSVQLTRFGPRTGNVPSAVEKEKRLLALSTTSPSAATDRAPAAANYPAQIRSPATMFTPLLGGSSAQAHGEQDRRQERLR